MKRILALTLAAVLLAGCAPDQNDSVGEQLPAPAVTETLETPADTHTETAYTSRFDTVTEILMSDDGITVGMDGKLAAEADVPVFISHDIIYYEDKDTYESGNPYGEGAQEERHSAQEAEAHMVVNITAPGAYRLTGSLKKGQIRVDLGEEAYSDENAVVELILQDAEIECTVAPAILFLNVYECDGDWSTDTGKPDVDTSKAGANLILEGENSVVGSHVARIFKDQEEEKKLWKQDGAIYSYMSMNVYGPGGLALVADNEGLDTELHLTVFGGDIYIRSGNDGINTNEDGVSVTTIQGGELTIDAGLGEEGDGIDSNGYLVINGGTVTARANSGADAGLDSDLGSFIHGGTVVAFGSHMDWAESDSGQVTLNLQFDQPQAVGAKLEIKNQAGETVFTYHNSALAEMPRTFTGAVISSPAFATGETYSLFMDGVQMGYTGTDVMKRPGSMDGMEPPEGARGERPELPEGVPPQLPKDFQPGEKPERKDPPEGMDIPGGMEFPQGAPGQRPQGFGGEAGEPTPDFFMQDKVNFFSGITALQ